MCAKQDPLYLFKWLQMGMFGFSHKETGTNSVAMATTQMVSFCFFCDVHFWCQVLDSVFYYSFIVIFLGHFCLRGKGAMRKTLYEAPTRETRSDHNTNTLFDK